jgi:signal peptidase I
MDTILAGTFVFLFRALVAQPFLTPSASMAPTLEVGDYLWTSKFSYGYSNYSFPFGAVLPAFTFGKTGPARGDVVVFALPSDPSTDYVKRVVGLPGDTVQVREGVTYLNGVALTREAAGSYDLEAASALGEGTVSKVIETLPDGRSYAIIEMPGWSAGDDTRLFTVPPGHYFVMGDNRDNSSDSRFHTVGFVPTANIHSKVVAVFTWPDGKFNRRDLI